VGLGSSDGQRENWSRFGANSNSNRSNVGYRDIDPECREQRSVIGMGWRKENGRH